MSELRGMHSERNISKTLYVNTKSNQENHFDGGGALHFAPEFGKGTVGGKPFSIAPFKATRGDKKEGASKKGEERTVSDQSNMPLKRSIGVGGRLMGSRTG